MSIFKSSFLSSKSFGGLPHSTALIFEGHDKEENSATDESALTDDFSPKSDSQFSWYTDISADCCLINELLSSFLLIRCNKCTSFCEELQVYISIRPVFIYDGYSSIKISMNGSCHKNKQKKNEECHRHYPRKISSVMSFLSVVITRWAWERDEIKRDNVLS